jgi:hypothetical protein
MTGNVDPTSIGAFRRCGFDGLLAKPFTQVRRARPETARTMRAAF